MAQCPVACGTCELCAGVHSDDVFSKYTRLWKRMKKPPYAASRPFTDDPGSNQTSAGPTAGARRRRHKADKNHTIGGIVNPFAGARRRSQRVEHNHSSSSGIAAAKENIPTPADNNHARTGRNPLKHNNQDCWKACSKQGECSWCGTQGACCRRGFKKSPAECGSGRLGCSLSHCCTRAHISSSLSQGSGPDIIAAAAAQQATVNTASGTAEVEPECKRPSGFLPSQTTGEAFDLSATVGDSAGPLGDPCAYKSDLYRGRTNLIPFDDLVGSAADPSTLFTCSRQFPPLDAPARYSHFTRNKLTRALPPTSPSTPNRTNTAATVLSWQPAGVEFAPLGLADVAIGMPVSGKWLTADADHASSTLEAALEAAATACAHGSVLACARHTWMASTGDALDVLLLADCLPLCPDGSAAAGCKLNTNSHELDSAFAFPTAPWTQPHASLAKLEIRCSWIPYRGLVVRSWKKTELLFRSLLARFPRKAYYVKMDADAVLRPKNLLHFLRFLHRQIDPGSPVYFGSAFGTYNCTDDPSDNCRSFTFNKGEPSRTDRWGKAKKRGKRLRESPEWLALEKELLILNLGEERWRAQQLVENRTAIMYALGGVYGMSRPAAERLIRSKCQRKLAAIRCRGCARNVGGSGMHTHEDANLGLCMRLNQAQLVTCACFHLMTPTKFGIGTGFEKWSDTSHKLSALLGELREGTMRREPLWSHLQHTRQLLAKVMGAFNDDSAASMHRPALCLLPIALHPIKHADEYEPMYRALEVRDMFYEPLLQAWRRDAAHARAEAGRAKGVGSFVGTTGDEGAAPISPISPISLGGTAIAQDGARGQGGAWMGGSDSGNANGGGLELSEGAIVSIVRAEVRKQLSGLAARMRPEQLPHVAMDTYAAPLQTAPGPAPAASAVSGAPPPLTTVAADVRADVTATVPVVMLV